MFFYVEYRRPIGIDDNLLVQRHGPGIYDGAMIRVNVFMQYISDYESMLLDMSPHEEDMPRIIDEDAAYSVLQVGQTFFDSVSGVAITTMDFTEDYLNMCVILGNRGDYDASGAIDLRDFAAFQNCYRAAWPISCECLIGNYDQATPITLEDFGEFSKTFGTEGE